jgi:predicted nuclease of restriction endonuclease-like RecB superfamily
MLTADLVDVRRAGAELVLRPLDARALEEALEVARALLDATHGMIGARREDVMLAWDGAAGDDGGPRKRKTVLGLRKLVEDGCTFEAETPKDPAALREALFLRAAEARRGRTFDRAALVAEIASAQGITPEELERGLFADLRSEHLLRAAPSFGPEALVQAFELGRGQAVLLAAVRVTCEVRAASPGPLRAFFAKLKFHQLLFAAERIEGGFRVVVDGPFSMFESVTKYGVRFALLLPALRELEDWSLVADLRWGKERAPLAFRLEAKDTAKLAGSADGERAARDAAHLGDDVRELLEDLETARANAKSPWRAEAASVLLDLPGVGICVPDLVLTAAKKGARPIYVEVLGFWSRDAVFRRIELARAGVGELVVFAVSSRLRVSPELLGEDDEGALYVYKGRMSARALLERVDALVASAVKAEGRRPSRAK